MGRTGTVLLLLDALRSTSRDDGDCAVAAGRGAAAVGRVSVAGSAPPLESGRPCTPVIVGERRTCMMLSPAGGESTLTRISRRRGLSCKIHLVSEGGRRTVVFVIACGQWVDTLHPARGGWPASVLFAPAVWSQPSAPWRRERSGVWLRSANLPPQERS